MAKQYRKSLFIFRRDLRLNDNTGLLAALRDSAHVIPCFIFDPRQVEDHPYRSENALQFMLDSLRDLDHQLGRRSARLYLLEGRPEAVVEELIAEQKVEAVYVNRDYTPFSTKRDQALAALCRRRRVDFHPHSDLLLTDPDQVRTAAGTPYTVFTAFFKKTSAFPVSEPQPNPHRNFWRRPLAAALRRSPPSRLLPSPNPHLFAKGGRRPCLTILRRAARFRTYDADKDYPARAATTGLSPHCKFGLCSIREVYHAIRGDLGAGHPLLRQLYWRDFFTHVAHHFPRVFGASFRPAYDRIDWRNHPDHFAAWCEGRTGFPLVDAGMRQLNTTGFMHNRLRMIVASFLTKDLHLDWRSGEQYFARRLIDYDPSVNNGNWQWAASTGCDAQPYFRIFNPWLQQKKFDPDCEYIKLWVPELRSLPAAAIHSWPKRASLEEADYPPPIVDHAQESGLSKRIYSHALGGKRR